MAARGSTGGRPSPTRYRRGNVSLTPSTTGRGRSRAGSSRGQGASRATTRPANSPKGRTTGRQTGRAAGRHSAPTGRTQPKRTAASSRRTPKTPPARSARRTRTTRPAGRHPRARRRRGGFRRLVDIVLVALVAFIALRLTVFRGSLPGETISDEPRLVGKSMGVSRTDGLFFSPYDWSRLQTRDGHLAYVKDGQVLSRLGIDVSEHNGDIDWNKVRDAGVEYAYIRAGYRGSQTATLATDARFDDNLSKARLAGLEVGVYFYSMATSEEEAREEAAYTCNLLDGAHIDYPIAFDLEPDDEDSVRVQGMTTDQYTQVAKAFCDECERRGFAAVVYGNQYELALYDRTQLAPYGFWYAEYESDPTSPLRFGMWQYTKTGTVKGIKTKVDMDLDLTAALAADDGADLG